MKLGGMRGLVLAAVPLAVAGAVLTGPMAGTASAASALPKQTCEELWQQVDDDFDQADMYAWDARDANNRGDWLAWGYYNALSAQYTKAGNNLLDSTLAVC